MTLPSESELKPVQALDMCPFCGGPAEAIKGFPMMPHPWYVEAEHPDSCPLYQLDAICHATRKAAITAWNTRLNHSDGWLPIETAPTTEGKYFFCDLAWGPADDICIGNGFRWNDRWFAAGVFYNNAGADNCQYEIRQIEVKPLFWRAKLSPPTDHNGGGL